MEKNKKSKMKIILPIVVTAVVVLIILAVLLVNFISNPNLGTKVSAMEIASKPTEYYGKTVKGYNTPTDCGLGWQIFYSDSENIYLIADYYINASSIPKGRKGSTAAIGPSLDLINARRDYVDIDNISENNPAKKLVSKFYESGYDSTKDRLNEMRYLLDIDVWNILKAEQAEYAIASPTVELYVESYNQTHPDKKIDLKLDKDGYLFKWSTQSEDEYIRQIIIPDTKELNNLYIINNPDDRSSILLVSYEGEGANRLRATFAADYTGLVGWSLYNCMAGLRPVVCLKSDVKLVLEKDGNYSIMK